MQSNRVLPLYTTVSNRRMLSTISYYHRAESVILVTTARAGHDTQISPNVHKIKFRKQSRTMNHWVGALASFCKNASTIFTAISLSCPTAPFCKNLKIPYFRKDIKKTLFVLLKFVFGLGESCSIYISANLVDLSQKNS